MNNAVEKRLFLDFPK